MPLCLFATDLHGRRSRYEKLLAAIRDRQPAAVFLGGDLLPLVGLGPDEPYGFDDLLTALRSLREESADAYPEIFAILGNDDPRAFEPVLQGAEQEGLLWYAHMRILPFGRFRVYGYACVPPTPFQLKDWERYDVSRYVDPGCVSPEGGHRSVPVEAREARYRTIKKDLAKLVGKDDLSRAILLLHTPPYRTVLDRAALDGKMIDHVPLDVNIGSVAVGRLIEERQPRITLHGHVHEACRLTGAWRERLGATNMFGAAHDGPELALVSFDPDDPESAVRELL